jgi:hypothetical protein
VRAARSVDWPAIIQTEAASIVSIAVVVVDSSRCSATRASWLKERAGIRLPFGRRAAPRRSQRPLAWSRIISTVDNHTVRAQSAGGDMAPSEHQRDLRGTNKKKKEKKCPPVAARPRPAETLAPQANEPGCNNRDDTEASVHSIHSADVW